MMQDYTWSNSGTNGVVTIDVNGASGSTYSTLTLGPQNWSISDSTSPVYVYDNHADLKVSGSAEISGQLKVGGLDIGEALKRIEERLAILRPNMELESRWEKLKELGDHYRKLETELLQQEEVISILQGS